MPSAIVCPDKFRGSMTALEAAEAIAEGLRSEGYEVVELPLADGGEGTLDVLVRAIGGSRRTTRVTGPLGVPVDAEWARLANGTAIVEMARASGIALIPEGGRDPLRASTRGTGELIAAAAREGARRVIVAVGGSASTDGGLGAVDALRWTLTGIEVVVACDVTTSFLRAAAEFGPQKGASRAQVALLERRLARLAGEYRARRGVDVTTIPGSGAAGGLAGGLAALGARLEPGFDVVADALGLADALEGTDLAVTGEGLLDRTSFEGKVVGGVIDRARESGVAVGLVVGRATDEAREQIEPDIPVFVLVERASSESEALERAAPLARDAAAALARSRTDGAGRGLA
jgi:glycerate 2-kinase